MNTSPEPRNPGTARPAQCDPDPSDVLKAMSPGVVDFLFRQLVAGESADDLPWQRQGTRLSAQAPGAELARRLAETDVDSLTPTELFHYVRAAQRLGTWAESLREAAVDRYCAPSPAPTPSARDRPCGPPGPRAAPDTDAPGNAL